MYGNTWFIPLPAGSKVALEDYYGELAADAVAKGFRYLKFDPWRQTGRDTFVPRKDARQIKKIVGAVRDAVGDKVELMIEVHGRLSPEDAIRAARNMEEFNPYWIEEPICPELSVDALTRVRIASRIPVASSDLDAMKIPIPMVDADRAVRLAERTLRSGGPALAACR